MDQKILIARFEKAKREFEVQGAYIAMGHYDVVRFRHVLRDGRLILDAGDRCFLPLTEHSLTDIVGKTMYRFLSMVNILGNNPNEKVKATVQALMTQLSTISSPDMSYSLYRSLESCDIACVIDSNDYPATLRLIKNCADSIDASDIYFFTIPMLNARMLDEPGDNEALRYAEVPNTFLLVRTTVKEHKKVDELLSREKLLKNLGRNTKSIMFGANDIVVDLGEYSPSKVIAYYRNVREFIAEYQSVLYSAEVEIMDKI